MAGLSDFLEPTILDLVFNATSYAGQSTVYTKLHVGDPGDAGTANAAGNTTRKATTFGAASGGAIANDNLLEWLAVSTTEDYTHFSLWDASSNGNCLWTGTITANAVVAGDTFQIAIGDLDITID